MMSSKIIHLVFTFMVLSTIESRLFQTKLKNKLLSSAAFTSNKIPQNSVDTLTRKRREVIDSSEKVSESGGEDIANLMKFFVAAAWEEDKLDVLSGFLEEMSDSDNNMTLIGWQRIYDDKGEIKEIRTIQLVIPPKPLGDCPCNIVEEDDDEDDDNDNGRILPHSELQEIKETFKPMELLGIPASVTMEEFSKNGEEEVLIYLDKDELYGLAEGVSIYNKTCTASEEEIAQFIKNIKPGVIGGPTVLYYTDGKLDTTKSIIKPHLLGSVIDFYEADDKILAESPDIIARISAEFPKDEIPKKLYEHYNKAYPQYKWKVISDPSYYYITRDITVTLSYDNFDFDENSNIAYLVFGNKL